MKMKEVPSTEHPLSAFKNSLKVPKMKIPLKTVKTNKVVRKIKKVYKINSLQKIIKEKNVNIEKIHKDLQIKKSQKPSNHSKHTTDNLSKILFHVNAALVYEKKKFTAKTKTAQEKINMQIYKGKINITKNIFINSNNNLLIRNMSNIKVIYIRNSYNNLNGLTYLNYHNHYSSNNCSMVKRMFGKKSRLGCLNFNQNNNYFKKFVSSSEKLNIKLKNQSVLMDNLYIIRNGLFARNGNIYFGKYIFNPYICGKQIGRNNFSNLKKIPVYKEVFSVYPSPKQIISKKNDNDHFQLTIESLVKLTPYLTWLLHNPQVKIHMLQPKDELTFEQLVSLMKLATNRFIFDEPFQSDLFYVPKGFAGGCSNLPLPYFQFKLFTSFMKRKIKRISEKIYRKKNGLLIDNPFAIIPESLIVKEAKRRNATIYTNAQNINLGNQIERMNYIDTVVLENYKSVKSFLWSKKGSLIIHLICTNDPNSVSTFYSLLAQVLSLRYHVIIKDGKCNKKDSQFFIHQMKNLLPKS